MRQAEINEIVRKDYAENLFFGEEKRFKEFMKRLSFCRLVGLDFDGTITAKGQVLVREDGREYILRSRKDSMLIPKVTAAGVHMAVISTEENPVVMANCRKIKVECFQGIQTGESKLTIFQRKADELGVPQDGTVFMGDDINDIPCLEWSSVAFCPEDAHIVVKEIIRQHRIGVLLSAEAGNGALRQLTELILLARNDDIKR